MMRRAINPRLIRRLATNANQNSTAQEGQSAENIFKHWERNGWGPHSGKDWGEHHNRFYKCKRTYMLFWVAGAGIGGYMIGSEMSSEDRAMRQDKNQEIMHKLERVEDSLEHVKRMQYTQRTEVPPPRPIM